MDNCCPHQGYALLQGEVKEETLTCAWHNWKFELDQGGRVSAAKRSARTRSRSETDRSSSHRRRSFPRLAKARAICLQRHPRGDQLWPGPGTGEGE
ncbi:MAG: Rieske 2Fe-2S domain-containing protein [Acidobacteria bacterium]|nr:Rieske 2Fe-2S domain-containing protein [Acidobacteriota bacterium]